MNLRTAIHAVERGGLSAVSASVGVWPHDRAAAFGERIGRIAARALARRRLVGIANLRHAFPESDAGTLERCFEASVAQLGRSAAEVALLAGRRRHEVLARVHTEGEEHLREAEALSPDGGLLVVSGHVGNWELGLAAMADRGERISVVHHGMRGSALASWLADVRSRSGDLQLLELGAGAGRGTLNALRDGRRVILLLDQNARPDEGVFAPFFGAPACTRRAPIAMALRQGRPLLPSFITRESDGLSHCVRFEAPLLLTPPEDRSPAAFERAVARGAARVNAAIEAQIRRAPEQWIWSHRRFRTRPESSDSNWQSSDEVRAAPRYPSRRR